MRMKAFISRVYGTFWTPVKGLALVPVMLVFMAQGAFASPATEVIEEFHDHLLTTMKNADEWTYRERRDYLEGPVSRTFNPEIMVHLASSKRYWDSFTDVEKAELAEAFEAFTLANYASRFTGFSGQKFVTEGEEEMRGKRLMVKTKLLNKGDEIYLNYVMYPDEEGKYRVIDVFQRGSVSELAIRKSEFSPILRDQGFTGLLSLLKEKVKRLEGDAYNPS